MKRSASMLAALSVAGVLFTNAAAMNGKHILMVGSQMKISTIQSDAVSASQTITAFDVESPWFNINGTKVACWKKDGSTWYLSIMDVTSKAFTDLLNANTTWSTTNAGGTIIWPAGDWIYFERPSKSGEIWRVNSTAAAQRELVIDYTRTTDPTPLKIYNFKLTADARLALTELNGMDIWTPSKPINGGIFVHRFPPTGDSPGSVDNLLIDLPNCNPCLSPTGAFCGRFYNGMHTDLTIYQWNESGQNYDAASVGSGPDGAVNSFDDIEPWSGQVDWANVLEGPTWSVNSDRWMTISVSTPNDAAWNSVLYSWADQKAIKMTNNTNTHSEGGCLYVEGTANSVQSINGTWSAIAPITLLPSIGVAGTKSPYQVTLSSKPTGADFYYTTDGTDPTQSSAHYTGAFSLSVSATAFTVLKVRAYLSGSASNVVQKVLTYDNTQSVGLTCELWTGITGAALTDLTSHTGYPDVPDRTWLAHGIANQYGSPWTEVSQGNNFGYRVRGYLVPQITGSYEFNVKSNSAISLKLGTSSSATSAVQIASIVNTGNVWNPTIVDCAPVTLQAGNWYYVEATVKGDASGYTLVSVDASSPTEGALALQPITAQLPTAARNIEPRGTMVHPVAGLKDPSQGAIYDALGNRVSASLGTRGLSSSRLPVGVYFVKTGNTGEVRRMVVRGSGAASIAAR